MAKRPDRPKETDILIWAGVIAQLNRTRSNQLLKDAPVPYPLFVLLRHFSHDSEREWSVTGLTAAFETGQSGMTKKVRKLLELGLIEVRDDAEDGRKRWFRISRQGLKQLAMMNRMLSQDQQQLFGGWDRADVETLHELLFRLKDHMDENRKQ